jgi:hypothetical protein
VIHQHGVQDDIVLVEAACDEKAVLVPDGGVLRTLASRQRRNAAPSVALAVISGKK